MNHHDELAASVVKNFKQNLSAEALNQISDTQFSTLALLVRQALSRELAAAADEVAAVVEQLRARVEQPEREL